jgi:FkbM family methyltransferase
MAGTNLESLILSLPSRRSVHSPDSPVYAELKKAVRERVEALFANRDDLIRNLPPFGPLKFPYFKMGATDSLNLFDIDELIIFSFYWTNRRRYKRVLDIGANIGLHSIILSKCGFQVRAYEPDPVHFDMLQKNLALNACANVQAFNLAVSNKAGSVEFVRVLGNTTGSHIAGSKPHPYGNLERISVKTENIDRLLDWPDLIKMDVEGHEKELLLATTRESWAVRDALVEIGSEANARAVFDHMARLGVNLFSQKTNWTKVKDAADMPFSYRDGTLFVTNKEQMPWDENLG